MSVTISELRPSDEPQVIELLSLSLGWALDDHHTGFFEWKHRRNPFGPSLAWVARSGGRIIGLRTFMRWEFEQSGRTIRAVRAVDTATHPDHRGTGVFSRLTAHGLDGVREAGVSFVFNTPNRQSRPGYLKLGWKPAGRVPLLVGLGAVSALPRVLRARTPADLWSLPTTAGVPAADALADGTGLASLVESQPRSAAMRTRRTVEVLRWRYAGFPPLDYRAWWDDGGPAEGLALFRLRRRGPAVEATICDVLAPGGDRRREAALARGVLRAAGADYAVRSGASAGRGFVPLPGQGPQLTWYGIAGEAPPPIRDWRLCLGDIELF